MYGKKDGKMISILLLKLEVVLDGLPQVDIAAVGQPKHQNFNGQDEEVGSLFSKEFQVTGSC